MTRCAWSPLWVLALAWLLPLPAAGQSGCDALTLKVVGIPGAASAECETHKLGGGDGTGTSELIKVLGPSSVFVVSHTYVGLRTYVIRQSIKDVIDDVSAFGKTENWGDEEESGDFDVRRFDAEFNGSGQRLACFGFSRYSGHVPNSSGYRHHIDGFYCLTGGDIATNRIDELMESIKYDFE